MLNFLLLQKANSDCGTLNNNLSLLFKILPRNSSHNVSNFFHKFSFLVCVCKQLELCHLQLLLLLPSRQLLGKAIKQGNNAEKGSIHSIRKMKLRKTYLAIKQQQTTEKETEKWNKCRHSSSNIHISVPVSVSILLTLGQWANELNCFADSAKIDEAHSKFSI